MRTQLTTEERRMQELARAGRRRGVTVTIVGTVAVVSDPHISPAPTVTAYSCSCARFLGTGGCQHHALLLEVLSGRRGCHAA